MARYLYELLVSNGKHHVGVFWLPTGMNCPTPVGTGIDLVFPGLEPLILKVADYVHHIMPDEAERATGIEPGDFHSRLKDWNKVGNARTIETEKYQALSKQLRNAGWIRGK